MLTNTSKAEIVHIYTPMEILEVYGKDSLIHYLKSNQFEIQSQRKNSQGKDIKLSYRQMAIIWEPILLKLCNTPSINLGQMIRNFYNPMANKKQKDDIIKNIFQITMNENYRGLQENHEAIMFGLAMMFQDALEWSNTESIIHIVGQNIENILDRDKRERLL